MRHIDIVLRSTHNPLLVASMLLMFVFTAYAQNAAYDGYTLYSSSNSRTTYLIDMQGTVVHSWQHALTGGYACYLLENGNLLRPASIPNAPLRGAASSGLVQEIDWHGNVVWEYQYSSPTYILHHDIEAMPNGNILMIAWEVKTAAQAQALGRTSSTAFWPDHIIEVQPTRPSGGTIVWKWHAWDHLVQDKDASKPNYGVISEHPGRLDINLRGGNVLPGSGDWLHINGISYNPDEDEIVISSHYMNEIYVIDHSTTMEEAAGNSGGRHGRGGDILYRWGNPANYAASGTKHFDVLHCSWWIPTGSPGAGNILAYNNGMRQRASEILEISPPRDAHGRYIHDAGTAFEPASPVWSYSNGTSFFSNHLGGNQRLPNGNTLIAESTKGRLFEVTASGERVWEHTIGRETPRALRYAADYPGLAALRTTAVTNVSSKSEIPVLWNHPNPCTDITVINYRCESAAAVRLSIHDVMGRVVRTFTRDVHAPGLQQFTWNAKDELGKHVSNGVYYYTVESGGRRATSTMLVLAE